MKNENQSANMKKSCIYVCPECGNIIVSVGQGDFSCCGTKLLKQEAQKCDEAHLIQVEKIDNEHYVTINHPMEKGHYISFLAYVTSGSYELIKLYPEQNIDVRFRKKGHGMLYAFCNQHGLFKCLI